MRAVLKIAMALLLIACRANVGADCTAVIACGQAGECPSGMSCRTTIARCVCDDGEDNAPPALTGAKLTPEAVAPGGQAALVVTLDEPVSTLELRLPWTDAIVRADDGRFAFSVPIGTPSGSAPLALRALDVWGNEATLAAATLRIDADAPSVTNARWRGQPATTRSDAVLVFEASTDADVVSATARIGSRDLVVAAELAPDTVTPHVVLSGTLDVAALRTAGVVTDHIRLVMTAVDGVGNSTSVTLPEVTVDTAAPTVQLTSLTPVENTTLRGAFTFASDDPSASFECSLDDDAMAACTSPFNREVAAPGPHTFAVRAIDGNGLVSNVASFAWNETRLWTPTLTSRCAIASDQSLWCWGSTSDGQGGVGVIGGVLPKARRVGSASDWLSVDVAALSTCGIRDDSGLASRWCWGSDLSEGLGNGSSGARSSPQSVDANWQQLSLGFGFGCGIKRDGTLWCWGAGGNGQRGDGTQSDSATPVRVGTDSDWVYVSAKSDRATCGIRQQGAQRNAYCWGGTNAGDSGLPQYGPLLVPEQVPLGDDWLTISAGNLLFCGLRGLAGSATLWCWGKVDSSTPVMPSPVQLDGANDWTQLASNGLSYCAAHATGAVGCWGLFGRGILPNGLRSSETVITIPGADAGLAIALSGPLCSVDNAGVMTCQGGNGLSDLNRGAQGFVTVQSPTGWQRLFAGQYGTCGIGDDNEAYCWGYQDKGVFRTVGEASDVPVLISKASTGAVTNFGTWDGLDGNHIDMCAVVDPPAALPEGLLYCWGQSFDGAYSYQSWPVQQTADTDWINVSVTAESSSNNRHRCAIRSSNRTLWCWGDNNSGQLGLGDTTARSTPTQVTGGTGATGYTNDWRSVNTAPRVTCGVRNVGGVRTLWCWGNNTKTPTQVGTDTDWIAVQPGLSGTYCGRRGAAGLGSLHCWGQNSFGQVGDGTVTTRSAPTQIGSDADWTRVAVGSRHACGIRAGSVYCWGDNSRGQVSPLLTDDKALTPRRVEIDGIEPVSELAVGGEHSCASGSALVCWGASDMGQLGDGAAWGPYATSGP